MINKFFSNLLSQKKLVCTLGCKIDNIEYLPKVLDIKESKDNFHISLSYENGIIEHIFITPIDNTSCTVLRRFSNTSKEVLHLNELFCKFSNLTFLGPKEDDYFYHVENPRMYAKFCLNVDEDHFKLCSDSGYDPVAGNRWSDPGTIHQRIGRSPYQPFPAILLSNKKSDVGIVHGTLSQKVFYHCYETGHDENNYNNLSIISGFKAIEYRNIQPNETLIDEWYIGKTNQAYNLEKIFDSYCNILRTKLPATYGQSTINRYSLVWGSWNDGNYRNIKEDQLLKTAQYIKENFPTVEWFQIDDGYAVYSSKLNRAHALGMEYEGNAGIDYDKFPNGMALFFDKIREIGLRPAIWIGGFCPKETPIYKEHPEWFINYDHRVTYTAPLDVSIHEVREYMEKSLNTFLPNYGCEGIKHDFWSYAFEESNSYLSNQDKSGYEYRTWWLQALRKNLPYDGYMQACCDIGMSNPFLGEYFTNYRYGIDIGHGEWENVKITFLWGAACLATHTGDLFIPNSDSVGIFPGLNDEEALFCLNYCLVTGSMVEIAGNLDKCDNLQRLAYLRKAVCCPNNGQDVHLAGFDYRYSDKAPEKFFFNGPYFSLLRNQPHLPYKTLGLFNLEDESKVISVTLQELNLPEGNYLAWDIWHEKAIEFNSSFSVEIAAHGSALFSIVPINGNIQILDSDLKITDVRLESEQLLLTFAYPGNATIHYFDGKEVKECKITSACSNDTKQLF